LTKWHKGQSKRGRGTKKQAFFAMVECGGNVKTKPVADVTAKTLKTSASSASLREFIVLSQKNHGLAEAQSAQRKSKMLRMMFG